MTITKEKTGLITADELLRLDSAGIRCELIRGVFYRVRPSEVRHGIVSVNICYLRRCGATTCTRSSTRVVSVAPDVC